MWKVYFTEFRNVYLRFKTLLIISRKVPQSVPIWPRGCRFQTSNVLGASLDLIKILESLEYFSIFHVPKFGKRQASRGRWLSISIFWTGWKVGKFGKFGKHAPAAVAIPVGSQSCLWSQPGETRMMGELKLCKMRLSYRQWQQERASRRRRDAKLAMRTGVTALRQQSGRRR